MTTNYIRFDSMEGAIIKNIEINEDKTFIKFFTEGDRCDYIMNREQGCCEEVWLDDVVGDLDDLIDSPVTLCEVRAINPLNTDIIKEKKRKELRPEDGYNEWTFYRIGTAKGEVLFRWCSISNGYYSVTVSLECSFNLKSDK